MDDGALFIFIAVGGFIIGAAIGLAFSDDSYKLDEYKECYERIEDLDYCWEIII